MDNWFVRFMRLTPLFFPGELTTKSGTTLAKKKFVAYAAYGIVCCSHGGTSLTAHVPGSPIMSAHSQLAADGSKV